MGQLPDNRFRRTWLHAALAAAGLGALQACGGGASGSADASQGALLTPPDPIIGLTATAGNSTSVTLAWLPSTGAQHYTVYWSESPGVSAKTAAAIHEIQSPYLHQNLNPGARYHYIVVAVNLAGESSPSAEVSALLPPGAPAGLSAVSGDSAIALQWNETAAAESYRVYWSNQPGVKPSTGNRIETTARAFTHVGLQNGTPYYYVVSAVGPGGEGTASAQVSAVPSVPVPTAPREVSATLDPGVSRTIVVAWQPPAIPVNSSDILGYRVYRALEPGVAQALAGATVIESGTQTRLTDTVPVSGLAYYYAVTALTTAGESQPSSEVSATPSDSSDGGGGDGSSGGSGGSFNCGEPVACWQDPAATN